MIAFAHGKRHVASSVLIGVFFAFGLAVLFLNTEPEYMYAAADDGGLVVSGSVPDGVEVRVVRDRAGSESAWTAAEGSIYVVSPDGVQLPTDVKIQMPRKGREGAYRIGWFDVSRGVWSPQETLYREELDVYETQTNHFSHWALLRDMHLRVSDAQLDRLTQSARAARPENAVGYRMDLAYATVDGDYVLALPDIETGACQSASVTVQDPIETRLDSRERVELDGEPTDVMLRLMTTWHLGSGCESFRVERRSSTPDVDPDAILETN